MRRLHDVLATRPVELASARSAIIVVLEFLSSSTGRTNANCHAVDTFLMVDECWLNDELPENYQEILADMSGALHDTVSAPHIAENFDSTPEQLLQKARALQ
jgi:hypothetical protein